MKSKKFLQLGLSAIVIASLIAPSLVAAEGNSSTTAKIKKTICVSDFVAKTNQKLANQEVKLVAARAKRDDTLAINRAKQEAKTATNRANWDARAAGNFTRVYGKAKTDARKQALTDFETAKTAAITARRAAVDTANLAFQSGVNQIIATRKSSVDNASSTYRTAINNIITTAQADCAAGVAPKTVKAQFNKMLKDAKAQFTANKKAIDQYRAQVEPLAKIHKAAIAQAQKDFTATMTLAKTAFKTAWKSGAPVKATSTPAQ